MIPLSFSNLLISARCRRLLSLLLISGVLAAAPAAAEPFSITPWVERIVAGEESKLLASELPAAALTDLQGLNALRLEVKARGEATAAKRLFAELAKRESTEAVLLNLSLAYVDELIGRNLLQKGFLSTRSQRTVERLIERDAAHWPAWYIRGINNLYWPDFFRKAPRAEEYLREAVAIHQQLSPEQRIDDRYALGYIALGDAYALLDRPDEARATWREGQRHYPFVKQLAERLALEGASSEALHTAIRAVRDADKPIDTDLNFMWAPQAGPFTITLTGGVLFGPGPLEDQPLDPGSLVELRLGSALNGYIPPFNNGASEPNLPGELRQGRVIDGLFSDGTPANEYVDVGFVSLMGGRFNLFLAAVQDGPHQGRINFFLDRDGHWSIFDDIGIDPGFSVGVVKFRDFIFSTAPRPLPYSRQTEGGAPAGVDRAGSIESGAVVPGALGDADFDGYLDGTFNAIGRFPYDSVILPGAPFAQTRVFESDIPISPRQAAVLTLGNGLAHLRLALEFAAEQPERAEQMRAEFEQRMQQAGRHLERTDGDPALQGLLEHATHAADHASLCVAAQQLAQQAAAQGLAWHAFDGGAVPTCAE